MPTPLSAQRAGTLWTRNPTADRRGLWARAGLLAMLAAILTTVIAAGMSTPVRATGGLVTGVDGTPMELEFLVGGDRCDVYVRLGRDGDPAPKVRIEWPDGHVQDVTTVGIESRTLSNCGTNEALQVVYIWPLYADVSGGSNTGPWLPIYGGDGGSGSTFISGLGQTSAEDGDNIARMTRVLQWGELGTTSLRNAFNRHHALIEVPDTLPSGVTNTGYMFRRATAFNQDISTWNVSSVTDMKGMFRRAAAFNQPLAGWERTGSTLGNVTTMSEMFDRAETFNQDISTWNVSSVTDMEGMFEDATAFNQPLAGWERTGSTLGNVTTMRDMFEGAATFNQPIGNWDVSRVEDMGDMFEDATAFNQPLAGWERTGSTLANVTTMSDMFEGAATFNQPIGNWDVSRVEDMGDMFKEAATFNQPIGNWDVSSVEDMNDMFEDAAAFNQPLAGWERTGSTLANVTRMDGMFYGATAFNQPVGDWDVSRVTRMEDMFRGTTSFDRSVGNWTLNADVNLRQMLDNSGMSSSCYDATLIGWAALDPAVSGRGLGADGREYSPDGAVARTVLVDDRGWTITGDTAVDVATGRCAGDAVGLSGGTDPVSGRAASMTLGCTPLDPTVGVTVTCTVTAGDADIDILWRAAYNPVFAEAGLTLGADGTGTFSFVVPAAALGQELTVELVEWTQPIVLGVVGGPVPASVPAGEGPVPAWSVGLLALLGAAGAVLAGRRLVTAG